MAMKRMSGKQCVVILVVTLLGWLILTGAAQSVELTANAWHVRNALLDSGRTPTSDPVANRYFNSFAGELYPDVMAASISAQREFRRALPSAYSYNQTAHYQNRADVMTSTAYASDDSVAAAAPLPPNSVAAPGSRWVMWDVPFLMRETRKARDRHLGYNQTVSGFATGATRLVGESGAVGFAVGYDSRKLTGRDGYHTKNKADTLHLALYGGEALGCFLFDGYAGLSRSWNRTERAVYSPDGSGAYEQNKGNFNDTVLSAGMKMNYVWIVPGDVRIVPSVGADFSHVRISSFGESDWNKQNNQSRLHVGKSTYANVQVPVMVAVNRTYASSFLRSGGHCSLWTPEIRAGYVPQFGSKRAKAAMRLVDSAGGPNIAYKAESAAIAESYGTAGAGLKIKLRDRFVLGLEYDVVFGKKYVNHSLTAMYGASF
ncbi:MAG: autotransporter outer membrane beta-barrel domain-containing protein [Planctomycetaceae bacterium]|nr:autotransporter outer membrane beta-barrel domain-containing protein [Planctomycetaceae bacterium]